MTIKFKEINRCFSCIVEHYLEAAWLLNMDKFDTEYNNTKLEYDTTSIHGWTINYGPKTCIGLHLKCVDMYQQRLSSLHLHCVISHLSNVWGIDTTYFQTKYFTLSHCVQIDCVRYQYCFYNTWCICYHPTLFTQ